jgi:hypothetical protein
VKFIISANFQLFTSFNADLHKLCGLETVAFQRRGMRFVVVAPTFLRRRRRRTAPTANVDSHIITVFFLSSPPYLRLKYPDGSINIHNNSNNFAFFLISETVAPARNPPIMSGRNGVVIFSPVKIKNLA